MGKQWQVWTDFRGDVWVLAGTVVCLRSGTVFTVGGTSGIGAPPGEHPGPRDGWVRVQPPRGAICLGGSGNNTVLSCAVTGVPVGLFRPSEDGVWTCADFPTAELTWYGDGSMSLHDGTDVVAQCGSTGSTSGPSGTLTATSHGRTTYHGGAAFSVTAAFEGGADYPSAMVTVSHGTACTGTYSATAADAWTSDDDPDWTITGDGTGLMELGDGTGIVTIRSTGSSVDPSGWYFTTEYGRLTYNSEADFATEILVSPAVTQAGVVYCVVTAAVDDSVSSVSGPFLAAALPAPSGADWPVPIALLSSVGGPVQILDGPLLWRGAPAGGGEPDDYETIRALTIAGI